jgi:hypothetical protein
MPESRPLLGYQQASPKSPAWALALLAAGFGVTALSVVMACAGGVAFTATTLPASLERIGAMAFWGCVPTALIGLVLIVAGIIGFRRARRGPREAEHSS